VRLDLVAAVAVAAAALAPATRPLVLATRRGGGGRGRDLALGRLFSGAPVVAAAGHRGSPSALAARGRRALAPAAQAPPARVGRE
jgi:hypothetical protein